MEIRGIDVSGENGRIDWKTVADYGMGFALLRVTEKGNVTDQQFEANYKGCMDYGIPVGVYKYSYAASAAEIQEEAQKAVEALDGRRLDFPVWLDLEEHEAQRNLSKETLAAMIEVFASVVTAAGYRFGIYSNVDWYKHVLPDSAKSKYDLWIASYPYEDDGSLQERLRPSFGVGWQYSSKARIPGITGNVDRDVFYKDYKEGIEMAKDLWTQTAELMARESGYLEKASESSLDSKTGNAGYNNYTKYARDVNSWGLLGCQGQPWCAVYQFWICVKIFGLAKALEIMGGGFYNCNSVKNHAKSKGTWHREPKLGALVIFRNGAHIGRVTKVTSTQVYTNEGNTSSGGVNNVEANGGCVADKVYTRNYTGIDGYVWIDYTASQGQQAGKDFLCRGDQGPQVAELQGKLIVLGFGCGGSGTDGEFGADTEAAVRSFQRTHGLEADGNAGPATLAKLNAEIMKEGQTQEGFRRFVGEVQQTCVVHTEPKKASPAAAGWPKLVKGNLVDVLGRYGYEDNWYKVCVADQHIGYAWADSIKRA